jgi:hypothetical protein
MNALFLIIYNFLMNALFLTCFLHHRLQTNKLETKYSWDIFKNIIINMIIALHFINATYVNF